MAPSQTESDRVADQLQLIAAYVRSLPGQPQLQQTQVQGVSKPHNELRDMKNRLRIIETQLQESKEESVEKLKDRIDSLEAQNGQLQTHNGQLQAFVESIANAVGVLQNDFVAAQAEITTWKAYKHNEDAKAYNKKIPASCHLRALHHPKTNKPIACFPQTLDDIKTMAEPSIRSVLNILGDLSDFYSKTQDLRGRLVAVVQGRDFHLI